jgi:hypothetical protein
MIISFSAGFICGVVIITAVFIIVGNNSEITYQVDRALKDKGL